MTTVGLTAAIVHIPWLLTSRRNVEGLAMQINEQVMYKISAEVNRVFDGVTAAQQTIALNVQNGTLPLNNYPAQTKFFMSLSQAYPYFTWVQIGYPNGDFLGVQRSLAGNQDNLNLHLRWWDVQRQRSMKWTDIYQKQGDEYVLVDQELKQEPIPFFSPKRPWYRNAIQHPRKQAWTVYVYRTNNVPGVDVSMTLMNQGRILGVVAIGLELQHLSLYLKKHQVSYPEAKIFIINSEDEMIASSDLSETAPEQVPGADRPRLKRLQDVQNPALQRVNQALYSNHLNLKKLKTTQQLAYSDPKTGQKHYITLLPLNYADWVGGIIVPESAYMGEIDRNNQALFFVLSGFIVLIAGLAIFQAERVIGQPLQQLLKAVNTVESGAEVANLDVTIHRDDEFGLLARSFEQMAQEVQARERDLEFRVQERTEELTEAQQILEASLREKEVLLKEIHHRVKNNLQIITSLLRLQSRSINNEEALKIFDDSQNRIRAMALIHEKLYQSPDLGRIDFDAYVRNLATELAHSYLLNIQTIQLKFDLNQIRLGIDKALPCGLMISEIISNALKHGFPSGRSGVIFVGMYQDSQGRYELIVRDDGIGIPDTVDFDQTQSLGLKLVRSLTRQLRGTVDLHREQGTEFRIQFTDESPSSKREL
ncbi:MAG: histidine kinase dimerization/phosphoacceptor domain -containing protein [Leptolyngbyaceae cyanobacterium bins.59]|nr:histidine kinase dimerization/phosphoacceptor domain -containing protein [Leptolyngbyaceae cyanobacterium bins.59]